MDEDDDVEDADNDDNNGNGNVDDDDDTVDLFRQVTDDEITNIRITSAVFPLIWRWTLYLYKQYIE